MTLVQKYIQSSSSCSIRHQLTFCDIYSFRNEEKLVALLVYSSFRGVATSGIRNSSVAISSIS